jgi:hypothetical protein
VEAGGCMVAAEQVQNTVLEAGRRRKWGICSERMMGKLSDASSAPHRAGAPPTHRHVVAGGAGGGGGGDCEAAAAGGEVEALARCKAGRRWGQVAAAREREIESLRERLCAAVEAEAAAPASGQPPAAARVRLHAVHAPVCSSAAGRTTTHAHAAAAHGSQGGRCQRGWVTRRRRTATRLDDSHAHTPLS